MTTQDLVDIGANLTDKAFARDRDVVINDAQRAGVTQIVLTGTTAIGSKQAADLAAHRPGALFSTAGVHPHYAKDITDTTLAQLEALCNRPEVVAVGECGLDFFRDLTPRAVQEQQFEAQLDLAVRLDLPVFLHERDAHARFHAILSQWRPKLRAAVVHCFTGDEVALRSYLDLDAHIGITGWICDERRGLHLREIVPLIPSNRLMIETDAPYLMPRSIRPRPKTRRNEPKWLPHVLEAVAQCRDEHLNDTARSTSATAREFFALPKR